MMFSAALPTPPSTNNLYRNAPGRGRVPTGRYLRWRRAAGTRLLAALASWRRRNPGCEPRFEAPAVVSIIVAHPRMRRDLDNCAKAPLDLLVEHGILADDSAVVEIRLRWGDPGEAPDGCLVSVCAGADLVSPRSAGMAGPIAIAGRSQ